MVEIQLRNAIDHQLRNWNQRQSRYGGNGNHTSAWIEDPAPPLARIVQPRPDKGFLVDARRSFKDIHGLPTKPHPTHDDLVAGLSLGAWINLLPRPAASSDSNPRLLIWEHALCQCFTRQRNNQSHLINSSVVYRWASIVRYARNRASHLEPLLDTDELRLYHRISLRLIHAMNPAAASWLAGQKYIPEVIQSRPY